MDRAAPQVCGYSNDEERNQKLESYIEEVTQKKIDGEIEDPYAIEMFDVVSALLFQYERDCIDRILEGNPRQFSVYNGNEPRTFTEYEALMCLHDFYRKQYNNSKLNVETKPLPTKIIYGKDKEETT